MAEALLDYSKFTEENFRVLDQEVQAAMERFGVPGVALGITYGGKEYFAGYGTTNVENPLPVTPDTFFQIGSTTKTLTATAIVRLVEMGKLELDAPVRRYLPDLTLEDESVAANVTVKHLLTHTAGWMGDFFADTGVGDDSLAKFVARLTEAGQSSPLGELWSYNNAAFSLAGRVIEAVTGKTYEASLKELLLEPLGMTKSFFFSSEVITYRAAAGHRNEESGPVVTRPWALPRSANAAGGLCTTVKDQMKYARFHMGDGTAEGGTRLLNPESVALMQTPVTSAGGDEKIGLSWFIANIGNVRVVKHGGGTFGQISAFMLAPDQKFAIAVVTNSDQGGMVNEIVTKWAFKHFLGAENTEPELINIPASDLTAYEGTYSAVLTSLKVIPSESDGMLLGTFMYHTNGLFEKDPPPISGIRLAFYGDDKITALDEPYKGTRGDFIRNKDGKLAWLRFGGRAAARQDI
jgi:CubicO group peptidase (beta-lactamase class C family)